MKWFDITVAISTGFPVWPGDPEVKLERVHKIEEGANSNVSQLSLSVHTGTHVDAPLHFISGAKTIDELPIDILVGPAQVVEIDKPSGAIQSQDLEKVGIKPGVVRLLLKTRNSKFWSDEPKRFHTDFSAVGVNGAEYLLSRGIRLVGIDYQSIAPYKQSRPTHEILLRAGVIILEGINLSDVSPGDYILYCLPLKLAGSDGSPARVILGQST